MTRPKRLGPSSEPEEKRSTPLRKSDTSTEGGGGWKKFSENKFGKSVIEFLLTGPFTFIYLLYAPSYLQSCIGGGITLPWCYIIAAILLVPVVGVIRFLWGPHWDPGQRKKGFALVTLIVLVITGAHMYYNKPVPSPPTPTPSSGRIRQISNVGKTFPLSLKPNEIYTIDKMTIRQGQQFTFLTYDAPIEYRVRSSDADCWERVTNNNPWRALINGHLQIRVGNSPVNLTLNIGD